MKRIPAPSRLTKLSGFTLVELLVVMGIIAILASVTLNIGIVVLNAAKRAKASNMATQIQTACLAYYTEYSVYPVPTGAVSSTPGANILDNDGTDWPILLCVLCGNIHPSNGTAFTPSGTNPTNTRAIAFLSLKSSDVFSATSTTGTQDSPVNPLPPDTTHLYFNIAMDADYAGVLGVAPSTFVGLPNFATATASGFTGAGRTGGGTSTAGVAVWANCTTKPAADVCNPNFWVRTY